MSTAAAQPPFRSERIPAEIWLQVIEGSSLGQEDIASLSLVGRHLRYVAQPMLFSQIQVTLIKARYLDTYTPVRCQHARYHNRLKKRLEFATSNQIACFVRSLSIRVAGDRLDVETEDAVQEGQILHEIFQELHHFVGLRTFSAQDISLDGSHFDLLAQLQHFNGIHLERCTCTGDLGLTRFKLKYLSLHGKMSGSYGWWIPLVTSSSVEHLSYDAPPPVLQGEEPEILFPALSVLPRPLHLLRTLRLPAHAQLFPCFVSALSRCSSVENLYIDPCHRFHPLAMASGQIALSHNTLPNLKAVGAPAHFIESLIMSRTGRASFKHISVWGQNYNAMEMLELIRDRCPDLEEIVVDLPSLHTMAPLDLLLLDFPALRGLYVVTNGHYPPYKQMYRFLKATVYPPNLRSLHIRSPRTLAEALLGSDRPTADVSTNGDLMSLGKTGSELISHIKEQSPGIVEVDISLKKRIQWRDMYTRRVAWYEWDNHGGRAELP